MRWALLLLCASCAHAHLVSRHDSLGEVLRSAPVVVLVEVTGPTRRTTEGAETPARRVDDIVGASEAAPLLVQRGGHLHTLQPGDLVLAPLERSPAGRWLYLASATKRPLHVAHGERRPARAFVVAWRAAKASEGDRLDGWIALTRHPAAIARRVGFEALSRNVERVRPAMNAARVERLAAALSEPEVPLDRKLAVVRVMGLTCAHAGADHLAARLLTLSPLKVRHAAANVVGRFLTPDGRRALLQCAEHAGGALAERCTRILARKGGAR